MRRPAKILLVGTIVATATYGAATSQTAPSSVFNDQVQLGDVFSQTTLNVVEVGETTTGVSTATGNGYTAGVDSGDVDMRSNQTLQGDVAADTALNVTANAGLSTRLTTAATGNAGEAAIVSGVMTGVYNQTTGPVAIYGHSHTEAPDAQAGDISVDTRAIGNSQGIAATAGATGVRVNQTNEAFVNSDGGGVVGQTTGTANFAATTAANNVGVVGAGGAGQRVVVNQNNIAANTQAGQFTAFGSSYLAATQATATGNNVSATNDGPILDVTSSQANSAYVRAQGESTSYLFSSGSASAQGVGNSLLAGDIGGELILDNTQFNDGGGIEAVASYAGTQGYDAQSSATAIGNSATGYACAECDGRIVASNRQTNTVDVGATSTTTIDGYARSAVGVATAVGNSGSFYSTRPGS